MKRITIIIFIISIVIAALAGYGFSRYQSPEMAKDHGSMADQSASEMPKNANEKAVLYWYDPMVPNQKFDKPGKSPFMDMQLVPKYKGEGGDDSGVSIPSRTLQNLGIKLAKVETAEFGDNLSAVGRIEPDERKFSVVQTKVTGYVEKLNVRAIGDPVTKGQKLAEIYAPELLSAQQEYLALLDYDGVSVTDGLALSARNRLKLLGMSEGEIASIARKKMPSARFGIYAPTSGVLTELGVREGGQLMPGSSLMQITDLSSVWLMAEVPERDVARVKLGATAELVLQGLPNEVFKGKVSYLYPTLEQTSRTLQVRVELPNRDGKLRPGMYGNVALSGKTYEALAVPSEAVIVTGKRKVVIVKEETGFRPVEVETGQERGDCTEITKGISANEQVVVSGQFLIDSEASLSGVLARLSQQEQSVSDAAPMDMDMSEQSSKKMPHGRGKVIEVNPKTNEITLSHEPIAELGWPAMTMSFKLDSAKIKDAKQLKELKPGNQVEFELKPDGQDAYMIDHIEKSAMPDGAMMGGKP